jgi:TolB-like protein/class 3 adenylate cyclase/Flp pilus assembly protein TadD
MPPVRRLTAILAADVAGYSRLMGADEEGTHERLKAHRQALIDPKISEYHGRIVKTTGDGMLVEFASVVEAVRCAVEVQRGIAERNTGTPPEKRIEFRIGVNLGDVIAENDDIFGDGVNVAARLEALAQPGGICISRMVRDNVCDKLDYTFEDLGGQQVKNIARPVPAYAMSAAAVASTPLVAARAPLGRARRMRRLIVPTSAVAMMCIALAVWWTWPRGTPSTPAVHSPAAQVAPTMANTPAPHLSFVVLPFENLSRDPDQEYFADGITDDLTTDLSRISGSFVIARNTAFTYKGKPVDVKQIGRELGVRYVIEGSVRRSNKVQVNVQLIDAETGAHLWADRFETDRANLAEAQNEITGRLARTLNVELFQAASRRIERERGANPDARDFAMRAWARVIRGPQSPATFDEALRLNQRALEIDPESVFAKNNMAQILVGFLSNGWSRAVQQDQARAEKLFREVLESDPNDARAHVGLGILRRIQNRLDDARIELETGIALDPNHTVAVRNLGLTLIQTGKPEEAIPYIEKSIRLSPHDPTVGNNYGALGQCHLLLGHLDQAIELLRQGRAANPRSFGIHLSLAGALGLRGDLEEARAEIAEAIKLEPQVDSLAALRAYYPWITSPPLWALREKTVNVGLRRAGFPDE